MPLFPRVREFLAFTFLRRYFSPKWWEPDKLPSQIEQIRSVCEPKRCDDKDGAQSGQEAGTVVREVDSTAGSASAADKTCVKSLTLQPQGQEQVCSEAQGNV